LYRIVVSLKKHHGSEKRRKQRPPVLNDHPCSGDDG
jgi:hypothetical protein